MAAGKKPEINLEIGSGFFRIPTDEVIYNITVLGNTENPVAKVVDRIVRKEKYPDQPATQVPAISTQSEDGFYKNISRELYHEIGNLAKNLTSTMLDIPAEARKMKRAELDEADEHIEKAKSQLKDIVAMTEKAAMEIMDQVEKVLQQADEMRNLLSSLKDRAAAQTTSPVPSSVEQPVGPSAPPPAGGAMTTEVREMLEKAREIITALQEESVTATLLYEEPEAEKRSPESPPFNIENVLQTIYELCTNETVKSHINTVLAKAETLFAMDRFDQVLKDRTTGLAPAEDNFIEVPISDVLSSLLASCNEDKIKNLLKRMDATQKEIFTVVTLPLEVPGLAAKLIKEEKVIQDTPMPDPRVFELAKLMEGSIAAIDRFSETPSQASLPAQNQSFISEHEQQALRDTIENAFGVASNISADVTKIMELLSFQDLSGQQILKIIKLLGDFQMQLMAILVSFGCRFKTKEKNASITVAESKQLAQQDVDDYFNKLGRPKEEETGMLDQDALNKLLEDLGF